MKSRAAAIDRLNQLQALIAAATDGKERRRYEVEVQRLQERLARVDGLRDFLAARSRVAADLVERVAAVAFAELDHFIFDLRYDVGSGWASFLTPLRPSEARERKEQVAAAYRAVLNLMDGLGDAENTDVLDRMLELTRGEKGRLHRDGFDDLADAAMALARANSKFTYIAGLQTTGKPPSFEKGVYEAFASRLFRICEKADHSSGDKTFWQIFYGVLEVCGVEGAFKKYPRHKACAEAVAKLSHEIK